jgi:hypothetical protein
MFAACLQHPRSFFLSMYQFLLVLRRPASCDLRAPSSFRAVPRLRTLPCHVGHCRRTLARDPAGVDLRVPGLPSLRLERLHE